MNRWQQQFVELQVQQPLEPIQECTHERKAVRTRTLANGMKQIVPQCLECGRAIGPAISRRTLEFEPPPFDVELARVIDYRALFQARRDDRRNEWFRLYNDYLQSVEWRQKRRKVLERDSGTCQGCGGAMASQVHHLTYEHVGDEFLFELASVCLDCHDRLHAAPGAPL